jgi:hypothetical protein
MDLEPAIGPITGDIPEVQHHNCDMLIVQNYLQARQVSRGGVDLRAGRSST